MKNIYIRDKQGVTHVFRLKFCISKFKMLEVEDVCVIYLSKFHNHRYDIKCFFYDTKNIYYRECIGTLKELYNVIQSLLKENLYSAMQNKTGWKELIWIIGLKIVLLVR